LNKKGIALFESLLSLSIILVLFTHFLFFAMVMNQKRREYRTDYEHLQRLTIIALAIERGEEIPTIEGVEVVIKGDGPCILYMNGMKRKERCMRGEP